jgi:hypothetical protein
MSTTNSKRDLTLINKIVLLDGITGTGKTMFLALLNSGSKTMAGQFLYAFEHICILHKMKKIDINDASVLLKLIADEKFYNNLISREVNFRPSDLSSVLKSTKGFKYLKQLFLGDGEIVEKRIKTENPIFSIVTHQLFSALDPLFNAFNDKLYIIEMERHPLYLIKHWFTWIDLYGKNPRDMTLCFDENGESIPWFAISWGKVFNDSNSIDRVIYSLEWLISQSEDALLRFPKNQIIFIPFEDFVLNPEKYLGRLKEILNEVDVSNFIKTLKKQNVPRKNIFEGPNKRIYRRYAFDKNMSNQTHQQNHEELLKFVEKKASSQAYNVLLKLNESYEQKYGLWF